MYLVKQYVDIIKVLRSLFSKPHMVVFDTFLRIVASMKLNEKVSKSAHISIACKIRVF
jgi:hypothetical protein